VEDFWRGPGETDITFIAFGDSQFGRGAVDKNELHVRAINVVEETLDWQAEFFGFEEPVSRIRGVIIAGDLTQNGVGNEYVQFANAYGLCGNRDIRYPVFEGYGNHDYFTWFNSGIDLAPEHPIADSVSVRNAYRSLLVNEAPGTDGHYAWEWDNVHFVMLNLKASDVDPGHPVPGARVPRMALEFLAADLAAHVDGTGKRVVVISHYGFSSSHFPDWWTEEEAAAYYAAVEGYDVIAYIHGHKHATSVYTWNGLSIYNSGSPFYTEGNDDGRGHFTLFRITNDTLYVGDVAWSPEDPEGTMEFPAGWHEIVNLG